MIKKTDDIFQWLQQQLRESAEIQLQHTKQTESPDTPINALLHELRVHQIELEMQNEELRRTQLALEESHDRYVDLYEFAPVAYLTLTVDGTIAKINLTASTLFGVERAKLINRRFAHYITPEDKDRWHRYFLQAKQQGGKHAIDLTLCRADDTLLYAHIDCLTIEMDDELPVLRITITDITERKQAEERLRIAAVAFETQAGIIITNAHKRIISVNQAFARITGYSTTEVSGLTPVFLRSGLHDEDFYRRIWTSVTRDGRWEGEIWDKRKNGELFPVWQTISTVTDSKGLISHYVASFIDISVQKQAEKVLLDAHQCLENQVATTQEELDKIKQESTKINTALNVLLNHRETDKCEAQNLLSVEVEGTVLPFLNRLKKAASIDKNQTHLLNILETNLQQLVSSYGRDTSLSSIYQKLTPTEIQVASMVRQGLSTKLIATTLNLSAGTIDLHRKHIRKKLGLNNKDDNLYSYLASLSE